MPFGTIKLNDGYEIPDIAFGTGTALRGRDAREYVAQALKAGFAHIDTAQYYQNEASVGEAIRESGLTHSDLFVTTKYIFGPIQQTVLASLAKLGLNYVDLYLIHSPSAVEHNFETAWKEFEKVRDAGFARSIGVSNFNLKQLQTIVNVAKIRPAVNQIHLHPYNYTERKPLLEYCAEHGIVIEAYGSLAPITKYPGGPIDAVLNKAANCRRATRGQIIFSWVRAKGAVIVTTSSNKQRLQEYLEAANITPLTEEEIAAIDEAGAKGPPALAPTAFTAENTRSDSQFLPHFLWLLMLLATVAGLHEMGNFRASFLG